MKATRDTPLRVDVIPTRVDWHTDSTLSQLGNHANLPAWEVFADD